MSNLFITLDGGTTNTRATLVRAYEPIDTVSTHVGVRDTRPDQPSPVLRAVAECLALLASRHRLNPAEVPVIASGMIGSDAGLVNVPHLLAPTTAHAAAGRLHTFRNEAVWPEPIYIIPGVRTGPDLTRPTAIQQGLAEDIMRGEETQAWGLGRMLAESRPQFDGKPWLLLWPGSHTKLISMGTDGSIRGSFTTLAGELFASLKSATLLARSLPDMLPTEFPDEIVAEAVQTVQEQGLLRAAFWTRVADITGRLTADQRAVWLSAAVIAADVESIGRHPWLLNNDQTTLYVGSDGLRRSLYEKIARTQFRCQVVALSALECEKGRLTGGSLSLLA